MDISEIRRRLRGAIEAARREAAERRERADTAARDYEAFLAQRAVPTLQQFASALQGEGLRFRVATPADSVRLTPEGASEDYIEIALDAAFDPPRVVGRSSRGRGRRLVVHERPVRDGAAVADLGEEDVLDYLIEEIGPFVGR
jgi:prophage DNA circulation protein